MYTSNNFSQYLNRKLSTLSDQNISKTGSLTFGSLTSVNKYLSIFENKATDLSSIDYEAIVKAFQSGSLENIQDENTQSMAAMMNEILAIQEINELADVSGDGEIDESELEALIKEMATADGENGNLSIDDVNALFDKMGIDLNSTVESAIEEALSNIDLNNTMPESAETAQNIPQQTQKPVSPISTGGFSGNSSGSVGSPAANSSLPKANNISQQKAPKTIEDFKQQIADKEQEIADAETAAEKEIETIESDKEQAMLNAGIAQKEYDSYKKQEQEVEQQIDKKDNAITTKNSQITEKKSTISSNENSISSIEAQIEKNNNSRVSSDEEDADSRNAQIDSMNANLQNEKTNLENENKKLADEIKTLENEAAILETEKAELENEKQTLLTKTLDSSLGSGNALTDVKNDIMSYDQKIADVRNSKNSNIQSIQKDIQSLQVEMKDLEAKDVNNKLIKENSMAKDLFRDDIELKTEYINNGKTMPYVLISPSGETEFDPEKPVLVYLHGLGEVGKSEQALMNVGPAAIMSQWGLENFDGYIICPHLTGQYNAGNWSNDRAEGYVRDLIEDFSSTHNVDSSKIAISGHSLGGQGAIYLAGKMDDVFCKGVSLSGYNSSVQPGSVNIPMAGYVGTTSHGEDGTSYNYMQNTFSNQLGAESLTVLETSHGGLPKAAFNLDADGNNRSDMLEWLFDDDTTKKIKK